MRRGSSFLIGLLAAAVTFGSLTAFIGPRHFGYRGYYSNYGYRDGYGCDGPRDGRLDRGDKDFNQKTKPADSAR